MWSTKPTSLTTSLTTSLHIQHYLWAIKYLLHYLWALGNIDSRHSNGGYQIHHMAHVARPVASWKSERSQTLAFCGRKPWDSSMHSPGRQRKEELAHQFALCSTGVHREGKRSLCSSSKNVKVEFWSTSSVIRYQEGHCKTHSEYHQAACLQVTSLISLVEFLSLGGIQRMHGSDRGAASGFQWNAAGRIVESCGIQPLSLLRT